MKAIILAAGKGKRMQPLTYERPKGMIPILGRPIIEYTIEKLVYYGFTDVVINVSYLSESIQTYFGDGRNWGVNISYSFEGYIRDGQMISNPLGSAGGIKRIQEFSYFFENTFLVTSSDAIIDLNLNDVFNKHFDSKSKVSIVSSLVSGEKALNYGVLLCDESGFIKSFQEKPSIKQIKSILINTGIYVFEPEVIQYIPKDVFYDIGNDLLPDLIRRKIALYAIQIPFQWLDIGCVNDYWKVYQKIMRGLVPGITIPGLEILPQVWIGSNINVDWEGIVVNKPVYIGSNSKIEAGCKIQGPTWISNGCHLEKRIKIFRSILFESSFMKRDSKIFEGIVSRNFCVNKDGLPIKIGRKDIEQRDFLNLNMN